MLVSAPYMSQLTFGANQRPVEVGQMIDLTPRVPFRCDSGEILPRVTLAYQTYGALNAARSNAILLNHGLTGDQYAAGIHPVTGKPGWWDHLIGPGKLFDTNRYFIIASNVLGGCMGSLGPRSLNPATGEPYGIRFPLITIGDMVRAQTLLVEALGIPQLLAVVGGSMGGMLALEWAARYPQKVFAVAAIATAARHCPQNIAFHEVGRQAIMADPAWAKGEYHMRRQFPSKGLAVARMMAHVTYLSEAALEQKFGRRLQDREQVSFAFDPDFQVESYLHHQGRSFIERFDPNAYLVITRAMDYFDLEADAGGKLANLFAQNPVRMCVMAFTSDWLFPVAESRHLVRALAAAGVKVSFANIPTDKGHDAFLLEEPMFFDALGGFVEGIARERGLI